MINASPDSLNKDSIAIGPEAALARARSLLAAGCQAIDLGGQGSTDIATVETEETEWSRLVEIIPALVPLGVPVSVDTWRPAVMRRSLEAGATVMNAADGLQAPGMFEVAADFGVPVVLPYLNGPDPRNLSHVEGDPIDSMVSWFAAMCRRATAFGVRDNLILDPGTGFAPLGWEWASRYHYQKHVYSNLGRLRVFGLPIYIALPWRDTPQHHELLDIVIAQHAEFGRCHYPAVVRDAEARFASASKLGNS